MHRRWGKQHIKLRAGRTAQQEGCPAAVPVPLGQRDARSLPVLPGGAVRGVSASGVVLE